MKLHLKYMVLIILLVGIGGCTISRNKRESSLVDITQKEVILKSCDSFPFSNSSDFQMQWALDSVGNLGFRNEYSLQLNDNLLGLNIECLEKYLGKANEYFGTEHVYYCGHGHGPGEKLMINYSDGIVTSVSYTLE